MSGLPNMKNNARLAKRLPVASLGAAVAMLPKEPNDRLIAEAVPEISRRCVNYLRRIAFDTPQHLPALLSGELSLYQAVELYRKTRTRLSVKLPEPKFCKICGSVLSGSSRKRRRIIASTRFCSRRCAGLHRRIDPLTRIKRYVILDENGCWVWQRGKSLDGYGRLEVNGRYRSVARIIFELHYGLPVPLGMRLHHKCHNPACCNPRHLEILGESELVERAPKRFAFVNRHKTHCIRGHEFVGESFFVNQVGSRVCRICREKYEKAYYAERKLKRLSNNHPDS